MRKESKVIKTFTKALCAATALYYIFMFSRGVNTPLRVMAPILMTGLIMAFLTNPISKRLPFKIALAIDVALAALSVFVIVFSMTIEGRAEVLSTRPTGVTWFVASTFIILILEAARRVVGWSLVIIVLVFMSYALYGNYAPGALWHMGVKWSTLIHTVSFSIEGIWGTPIRVIAEVVVMFMLFSSFYMVSGASDLFMSVAQSAFGRFRGGAAKMAVVASTLFGMISGSGVANVAATGAVTIPLMKKSGYPAHVAAGIEALTSTGGQIMPPVMGAAAFVLAEFVGVSYWSVVKAAILPALLYYFSLFMFVDFQAGKLGLGGLAREEIPDWKPVWRRKGLLILPLILLVVLLGVFDMSITTAALYSVGAIFVLSFTAKGSWMTPRKLYQALADGVQNMTSVTAACGAAAVLMGLVAATNFGMNLSGILIDLSHGNLAVLLILTAVVALILGTGLSTTAVYLFLAIMVAPALVKAGVPILGAHLFIFFYGVLSMLTPPYCTASFTAAAIADAPPMKTAWWATFRGVILYIVPFYFVYDPALLMEGNAVGIILGLITSVLGIFGLVAAIEGYVLFRKTEGTLHRLILGIGGAAMIIPTPLFDVVGAILLVVGVAFAYLNHLQERRAKEGVMRA